MMGRRVRSWFDRAFAVRRDGCIHPLTSVLSGGARLSGKGPTALIHRQRYWRIHGGEPGEALMNRDLTRHPPFVLLLALAWCLVLVQLMAQYWPMTAATMH